MIMCYRTNDIIQYNCTTLWLLNYREKKILYWIMILQNNVIRNRVVIT